MWNVVKQNVDQVWVLWLSTTLTKIAQSLFPVTRLLQNPTTNFDETLHVAQAYPKEGFIGMSRYPLDKK